MNCTPVSVNEFPSDFMSSTTRENGGIALHIAICIYVTLALGILCDEYFIPALEVICKKLNLKQDVAGATFMAIGTSSPEFFTHFMATFVTNSPLGIGTILGSAIFNILGIVSFCGIFSNRIILLDWYPILRDSLCYALSILVLIVVMYDGHIVLWESVLMVLLYSSYLLIIWYSESLEGYLRRFLGLRKEDEENRNLMNENEMFETENEEMSDSVSHILPWNCSWNYGVPYALYRLLFFPINFLYFLSIPTMSLPSLRRYYIISFITSILWIAALSYVNTWMITVIGYNFGIPDSLMGLTFLAVGTSLPEIISSVIVSRAGKGTMAISNALGSNTFDILLCLGIPWLIKGLYSPIKVLNNSLEIIAGILLCSLFVLLLLFLYGKFLLNKNLGYSSALIYTVFLILCVLLEMNVFFIVNLPACLSAY